MGCVLRTTILPSMPVIFFSASLHLRGRVAIFETMKVHRRSHGHSIVYHVHTQRNVHFLWLPWLQAMSCTTDLQEMDLKHEFINYFKRMPSHKIAVIIPAVCFWVTVKCMESLCIRSNDLACIIDAVQQDRKHCTPCEYTLKDLLQAENAVLQWLYWDIIRKQEKDH